MGGTHESLKHTEPNNFSFETDHDISFIKESPNKKMLLVGWGSNNIRLFDLASHTYIADFEGCTYSKSTSNTCLAAWSPDSKHIAYRWEKDIRIWDTTQNQMVRSINNHDTWVTVSYSPDGNYLLVGCRTDLIKLYDLNKDSSIAKIWEGKARVQSHI